eukprot:gene25269-1667_t
MFRRVPLTTDGGSWVAVWRKAVPHSQKTFDNLWALHPETFNEIQMHGKLVKIPRWQRNFGSHDYKFSGQVVGQLEKALNMNRDVYTGNKNKKENTAGWQTQGKAC